MAPARRQCHWIVFNRFLKRNKLSSAQARLPLYCVQITVHAAPSLPAGIYSWALGSNNVNTRRTDAFPSSTKAALLPHASPYRILRAPSYMACRQGSICSSSGLSHYCLLRSTTPRSGIRSPDSARPLTTSPDLDRGLRSKGRRLPGLAEPGPTTCQIG